MKRFLTIAGLTAALLAVSCGPASFAGTTHTSAVSNSTSAAVKQEQSCSLSEYSIYTDEPDFASLDDISEVIRDLTGHTPNRSDTKKQKTIVFTVDDNLRMLEYSVKESNGILTFAVYTRYALPYMDKIVRSYFSGHGTSVPSGCSEYGTYSIDSAESFSKDSLAFTGETDKNPLSYGCGDSVTFRVSLLRENRLVSAPLFHYEYRTDDGAEKSGYLPGQSGQLILTLPGCSNPGTSKLEITAVNQEHDQLPSVDGEFTGSAVFGFDRITTARPAPADFRQFWDAQMSVLMASSPSEVLFEKCGDNHSDHYDIYDAVVDSPWDKVYLHITVPKNASPHSLQIRARYQSYGFDSADPYKKEGVIGVSVNPHSIPNDKSADYYDNQEDLLDCWVDDDDTRENCYFLGMIMRDIQAIRYVENKFSDLWNGKEIDAAGGSMGGFQAVAVSALYDKVTSINISIPWMCDIGGGDAGRNDGWAPDWSEAGQYYDTCYFAPYVKCKIRGFSAKLGDYVSPPSGVVALYNALQPDKKLTFTQNVSHSGDPGPYDPSYTVSGSPAMFEKQDVVIRDNGQAID